MNRQEGSSVRGSIRFTLLVGVMEQYFRIFLDGYKNYGGYLWREITQPGWHNYFYWLLGVSAFFLILEWVKPWRKEQPKFRKDFWLDFFYMFFNFFIFSLIIYNAASHVVVNLFNNLLGFMGINNLLAINVSLLPVWAHLLIGFVLRDFIQWWIHRLLHRSDWLWQFHKVHHSVEQMGFAAHLRYHWMENVVYRTIEYIPLAMIGIGLNDFFVIHIFSLAIGHYNHSNISVSGYVTGGILGLLLGVVIALRAFDVHLLPESVTFWQQLLTVFASVLVGILLFGRWMKYVFNHPEMHIWHHAYHLPENKKFGVNFGLSLSIWDYLFSTVYMPYNGRDIQLGFEGVNEFPHHFLEQNLYGVVSHKSEHPPMS